MELTPSQRPLFSTPPMHTSEINPLSPFVRFAPQISSLSKFVDETLNRTPDRGAPYVGASAFAHKGGLHVAALERSPDSYQVRARRSRFCSLGVPARRFGRCGDDIKTNNSVDRDI